MARATKNRVLNFFRDNGSSAVYCVEYAVKDPFMVSDGCHRRLLNDYDWDTGGVLTGANGFYQKISGGVLTSEEVEFFKYLYDPKIGPFSCTPDIFEEVHLSTDNNSYIYLRNIENLPKAYIHAIATSARWKYEWPNNLKTWCKYYGKVTNDPKVAFVLTMLLQTADGYKSHTVLSPTYHNPFRTYNSVERIVESKPLFDNKKDVSATALCSHRTVSGKPTSLWGLTDEHGTTFNRLKSKLLAKASGQAELNFLGS